MTIDELMNELSRYDGDTVVAIDTTEHLADISEITRLSPYNDQVVLRFWPDGSE